MNVQPVELSFGVCMTLSVTLSFTPAKDRTLVRDVAAGLHVAMLLQDIIKVKVAVRVEGQVLVTLNLLKGDRLEKTW